VLKDREKFLHFLTKVEQNMEKAQPTENCLQWKLPFNNWRNQ